MKNVFLLVFLLSLIGLYSFGQDTVVNTRRKPHKSFLVEERPFTIIVPIWIPGFSGNFAYGDVDIEGEDGTDPGDPGDPDDDDKGNILKKIFSSEFYLKFLFLLRVVYEKNNFLVQFDAVSGSVGGSTKFVLNNKEIVKLRYTNLNARLFGGYRLVNILTRKENFRYELYGYLGLRYHQNRIFASFLDDRLIYDIWPGWGEPIIGIQNQLSFKRWLLIMQGDLGGFNFNNRYSYQISASASYRMGRFLGLLLGWNHLTLNYKGKHKGEDLSIDATFSGPSLGLAIYF